MVRPNNQGVIRKLLTLLSQSTTMSDTLAFRPRFKFHSELSMSDINDKIVKHSKQPQEPLIEVQKVQNHLVLSFPKADRHFWTPHMDINLEEDPDHPHRHVLTRCLIAPSPTVWTMFTFVYGFFGFLGFVGLTLAMSQWTLKKPIWGLWLLLASVIGVVAMYLVSYEGKRLARDEMYALKKFVDDALGCDCIRLAEEQTA